MSDPDANHVADTEAEVADVQGLLLQYAEENALTKRRLDQQDRQLDQQDKQLKRRGRLGALAALVAIAALGAIGYFWRADVDARHAADERAQVVRGEVDQTLGIAHTFLCQQQPTPAGCPPAPTPTVSPNTQAIINDIVSRIEQIYPPPNGLR